MRHLGHLGISACANIAVRDIHRTLDVEVASSTDRRLKSGHGTDHLDVGFLLDDHSQPVDFAPYQKLSGSQS